MPSLERLIEVARLLGCSLGDLLGELVTEGMAAAEEEAPYDQADAEIRLRVETPLRVPAGSVIVARIERVEPPGLDTPGGGR